MIGSRFFYGRQKWLVAIVVTIFAVAVVQLTRTFVNVLGCHRAFKTFATRLIEKDYHDAYSMTDANFQGVTSEPEFVAQQELLTSKLGDLKQVKQLSFDTSLQHGFWSETLTSRFVFSKAEREFDFKLRKEGETWFIQGYRERD